VASFVGHDDALAALRALLTQGDVAAGPLATRPRLITLTGVGGCGKTSLAIRAAADQVAAFADGVWLADLALRRQFLGELTYSRTDLALAERLFSEA
jgi:adenylylsulfate kinase-like enzyme